MVGKRKGVASESRSGQEKTWIDYAEAQHLLKSKSLKCNVQKNRAKSFISVNDLARFSMVTQQVGHDNTPLSLDLYGEKVYSKTGFMPKLYIRNE